MVARIFLALALVAAAIVCAAMSSPFALRVNGERLNARLAELTQFGKTPEGGTHRVAYSDADMQARAYAMQLMREAKLDVGVDAAGNIVGRRSGSDATLKPLMIGSHIDSVPAGGNYDGQVGSMGAIEVAMVLAENDARLKHPLEVVLFQNEEGGTIGSVALSTGLSEEELKLVTHSGKTIREGIKFIGGDPERLASAIRKKGDIAGYLELHIEQGGTLDRTKTPIGIVEGIVAIHRYDAVIEGTVNHAGTTPMNERHDAMVAAAELTLAVRDIASRRQGRQVGTVGRIEIEPNSPNVIPGRATISVEFRDLSEQVLRELGDAVKARGAEIAKQTGTTITFTLASINVPATATSGIQDAIGRVAERSGLKAMRLPSGAGHDAQQIAKLCPMGMIFVPSVGGISHSPKELTNWEDCANGANVLLKTVLELDQRDSI